MTVPRPTAVVFSHEKYGQPLAVDASPCPRWTGIVIDGEAHVLDFYEFLLVSRGSADVIVDDRATRVSGPAVVFTPPRVVRRIEVVDPLDLLLVVFSDRALNRTACITGLKGGSSMSVRSEASLLSPLQDVARLMTAELTAPRPDSAMMLDALLAQFLITVNRASTVAAAAPALITRFERLLERRFREEHAVGVYASALGVSADHLSAVIRSHLAVSAKALIDRRVFAEAVRLVTTSSMPIADIGAALGFDEPAHFARFFGRMSGRSPRRFRAAH